MQVQPLQMSASMLALENRPRHVSQLVQLRLDRARCLTGRLSCLRVLPFFPGC